MFTNNLQSKRSDADKKQNNTYQVPNCLLKHKTEVVTIIWIAKRLLLRAFNFGTKIYTIWFIMYFIFLCLHLRCVDISTIHGFVYHETKNIFWWYFLVIVTMFWQNSSFLELSIQERKPENASHTCIDTVHRTTPIFRKVRMKLISLNVVFFQKAK